MFDIESVNKDITFSNHNHTRLKNLLVSRKTYQYFPLVGFDFDFFIKNPLTFSMESFTSYLYQYFNEYQLVVKKIEMQKNKESLSYLTITLTL